MYSQSCTGEPGFIQISSNQASSLITSFTKRRLNDPVHYNVVNPYPVMGTEGSGVNLTTPLAFISHCMRDVGYLMTK